MQLDEADIVSGIILGFRKAVTCLRVVIAHEDGMHRKVKAAIGAGDLAHD